MTCWSLYAWPLLSLCVPDDPKRDLCAGEHENIEDAKGNNEGKKQVMKGESRERYAGTASNRAGLCG